MVTVKTMTGEVLHRDADSYIVGESGELDVMVGVVAIRTYSPQAWDSVWVHRTAMEIESINAAAAASDEKVTAGWGEHQERD